MFRPLPATKRLAVGEKIQSIDDYIGGRQNVVSFACEHPLAESQPISNILSPAMSAKTLCREITEYII